MYYRDSTQRFEAALSTPMWNLTKAEQEYLVPAITILKDVQEWLTTINLDEVPSYKKLDCKPKNWLYDPLQPLSTLWDLHRQNIALDILEHYVLTDRGYSCPKLGALWERFRRYSTTRRECVMRLFEHYKDIAADKLEETDWYYLVR